MHQPIGRYPPTISAPLATADNRDSGADMPIAADRMMHSTVTPAVEYMCSCGLRTICVTLHVKVIDKRRRISDNGLSIAVL